MRKAVEPHCINYSYWRNLKSLHLFRFHDQVQSFQNMLAFKPSLLSNCTFRLTYFCLQIIDFKPSTSNHRLRTIFHLKLSTSDQVFPFLNHAKSYYRLHTFLSLQTIEFRVFYYFSLSTSNFTTSNESLQSVWSRYRLLTYLHFQTIDFERFEVDDSKW